MRTNFNDAEYSRSNGASTHRSIAAYNAGATGQGVKIAVVDTGINPNLAEFAGKIDPASRDVAASRGITDTEGHGTAVAAVAAAARNGQSIMGVAFDATILSFNTSDPTDCDPDDGCTHSDSDIAQAIDLARLNGAKVINISLGGPDPSATVNAAISRAAAAGVLVIMSAGNAGADPGGASPEGFSLSASDAGNVIIAGAMDGSRNIAGFSNKAGNGVGASRYLTALGVQVRAPDQTGTSFLWSGTSFSAPVISGAAALLASAFPNLTGQQIMAILLSSADDAGAAGTDPIFGRGILNVERAFQPIGTLSLPDGKQADPTAGGGSGSTTMGDAKANVTGMIVLDGYSRAYAVTLVSALQRAEQERPLGQALQPGLRTGTAAARGVAVSITVDRKLSGQPHVGLAQLGLTYEDARKARVLSGIAVSRLGRRTAMALGLAESGKTLERRLTGRYQDAFLVARDPMARTGFHGDSAGAVGLRRQLGRTGVTVTAERGEVWQPGFDRAIASPRYDVASLSLDRRLGRARLGLGASRLDEEATLLGARFAPTIGVGGGTSWFADARAAVDLGRGWGVEAAYRRGWTDASGFGGGLARGGRLSTDAWTFDIARSNALRPGDRFALRVMQPLRVRSGGFDLSVPVSYSYDTLSAGYEDRFFNLAPTGREIDLEAAYGFDLLGGAGHMSANAFARRDPGNVAAMKTDLGAAIRFTLGF